MTHLYEKLPLVVTAKEMAEMDRRMIEEFGIPGIVLMENAGREVAAAAADLLGEVGGKRIGILCGKGNNGGDGYVVARYLADMGARVQCYVFGEHDNIKGDARTNLNLLKKNKINVLHITEKVKNLPLSGFHLLIDALLGTGVAGPLKSKMAEVVDIINQSNAPVIAIDLPTGMETDTGKVQGGCVQADLTVTMACRKRGLLFSPGREHAGLVSVADIGIPRKIMLDTGASCFELTPAFVTSLLATRLPNAYKNKCGQVLVLAGAEGMTGAAALTSEATLRAGAGLTILGIPKSMNPVLEQKLTEVMTLPLPETSIRSISFDAHQNIAEKLDWADVIAVGPGLTLHADSGKLVQWLLQTFSGPVVLDADALNSLADAPEVLPNAKCDLVLTPHPGELARLTRKSHDEILTNPVASAREAASSFKAVVVLKGGPTVIASPEGATFINPTGNPGMATAGMGDVLTGVIAGLIAQSLTPLNAALAGVYIHGLAGDLAAESLGERGLLASDVMFHVALALKSFEGDA